MYSVVVENFNYKQFQRSQLGSNFETFVLVLYSYIAVCNKQELRSLTRIGDPFNYEKQHLFVELTDSWRFPL